MKPNAQPIPLRSIVCLPRWLMRGGVVLSVGCMLAGVALLVYAIGWAGSGDSFGGAVGGAIGCLIGGAGGLYGTLNDWYRRLPATVYLRQLQNDEPNSFYRRVFWPAVTALAIGLVLACFWSNRAVWQGIVQTSAILAFIAGCIEASRRHSTRQAQAVFALYADGALDAEDTAAIDDARAKDPKFDTEVQAYLAVSERLRSLTAP